MRFILWFLVTLVITNAGWMTYDGIHAMVTGDYVTPDSGRFTGQLGPRAPLVRSAGIPPRSLLMKWIFVLYGGLFVAAASCYFAGLVWAPIAVIVMALLGLWYVPFGTLINIIVIALVIAAKRAG